eukprot:Clim_evm31s155 gene=Clim_evmTU31s155
MPVRAADTMLTSQPQTDKTSITVHTDKTAGGVRIDKMKLAEIKTTGQWNVDSNSISETASTSSDSETTANGVQGKTAAKSAVNGTVSNGAGATNGTAKDHGKNGTVYRLPKSIMKKTANGSMQSPRSSDLHLRLTSVTWDIDGIDVNDVDFSFLVHLGLESDILFVGLQDMDKRPSSLFIPDRSVTNAWTEAIVSSLNLEYRSSQASNMSSRESSERGSPCPSPSPYSSGIARPYSPSGSVKSLELRTSSGDNNGPDTARSSVSDFPLCGDDAWVKVTAHQLGGISSWLFARQSVAQDISDIRFSSVARGTHLGPFGRLGDRGAVLIQFHILRTHFCLVNCHLSCTLNGGSGKAAAGDVASVAQHALPPSRYAAMEPTVDGLLHHDVVVWCGNFNYRISLPIDEIERRIREQDWEPLRKSDQLRLQCNRYLNQLQEGSMTFPPVHEALPTDLAASSSNPATKKVSNGKVQSKEDRDREELREAAARYQPQARNRWSTSSGRYQPGWTDRILYKGATVHQRSYTAHALKAGSTSGGYSLVPSIQPSPRNSVVLNSSPPPSVSSNNNVHQSPQQPQPSVPNRCIHPPLSSVLDVVVPRTGRVYTNPALSPKRNSLDHHENNNDPDGIGMAARASGQMPDFLSGQAIRSRGEDAVNKVVDSAIVMLLRVICIIMIVPVSLMGSFERTVRKPASRVWASLVKRGARYLEVPDDVLRSLKLPLDLQLVAPENVVDVRRNLVNGLLYLALPVVYELVLGLNSGIRHYFRNVIGLLLYTICHQQKRAPMVLVLLLWIIALPVVLLSDIYSVMHRSAAIRRNLFDSIMYSGY